MNPLNEKAESPIEILFTVMVMILTMTVLVLTMGNFVDMFMYIIANIDITLSAWGTNMMNLLVYRYATWFFLVPVFFCLLILIWGVKAAIKKHEYTTQDPQFMPDEF